MAAEMSSNTAHPPDNQTFFSDLITLPGVRYTLVALHICVIILAAVGNGFLIIFIVRRRKQTRRNVTACLVFNLAVCDFLNTVAHQPLRLVDLLRPNGSLGDSSTFCQVGGFFTCYLATATFLTIVAIAVERWLLICHPLRAKSWLTIRKTRITLVLIWVVSFLTVLPFPIVFHYSITVPLEQSNVTFCLIDVFSKDKSGQGYFIFLFLMYYAGPVCIITAAYTCVFRVLYSKGINRDSKDESVLRVMRTRKSLAKMMLFIAALFAICEGPYFFTFLVLSLGHKVKRNPIFLLMVIEFLPMISAVLNPVIYSLRAKTFRKGLTGTSSHTTQRRSTFRSDIPLRAQDGNSDGDGSARAGPTTKASPSNRQGRRYDHVEYTKTSTSLDSGEDNNASQITDTTRISATGPSNSYKDKNQFEYSAIRSKDCSSTKHWQREYPYGQKKGLEILRSGCHSNEKSPEPNTATAEQHCVESEDGNQPGKNIMEDFENQHHTHRLLPDTNIKLVHTVIPHRIEAENRIISFQKRHKDTKLQTISHKNGECDVPAFEHSHSWHSIPHRQSLDNLHSFYQGQYKSKSRVEQLDGHQMADLEWTASARQRPQTTVVKTSVTLPEVKQIDQSTNNDRMNKNKRTVDTVAFGSMQESAVSRKQNISAFFDKIKPSSEKTDAIPTIGVPV